MDTRTGRIGFFETKEEAKEAGHNAELSEAEAQQLQRVQEEKRLAMLRQMRADQLAALRTDNPYAKKKRTQKNRQKSRMKGARKQVARGR